MKGGFPIIKYKGGTMDMEYDIGSKIKAARLKKKMTQEQVAELLGVSRQTISNWENEKSYPDIISVIKMSDYYEASLDYLLKGEQKMNTYYDYLEESTNVVTGRRIHRYTKLYPIASLPLVKNQNAIIAIAHTSI